MVKKWGLGNNELRNLERDLGWKEKLRLFFMASIAPGRFVDLRGPWRRPGPGPRSPRAGRGRRRRSGLGPSDLFWSPSCRLGLRRPQPVPADPPK